MSDNANYRLLANMNIGFWGAQVANGLQTANASAIFESLGAEASQLPLLWLGAPIMGLVVQPIIGELSDCTWCVWGRRQPFFVTGAILGFGMIILMPNSTHLWQAVVIYWLLQFGLNVGTAPARSFVGDLLPSAQRTLGYSIQGFCIGLGAIAASMLPWLLEKIPAVESTAEVGVPTTICWAYYVGAVLYLVSALWTYWTVKEAPPAPDVLEKPIGSVFKRIAEAFTQMPPIMRQLAGVQLFTWFGVYCTFLYLPTAIAINILGAPNKQSPDYVHGIEWAGICIAFYNLICLGTSLLITPLSRRWGKVTIYAVCLMCGTVGLLSLALIHSRYPILLSMVGIGIAWAGILSIPYALLIDSLPDERSGVYMGLFNCFLALPQIVMSLSFGWIMTTFLQSDRLWALLLGGVFFGISALLMLRVTEPEAIVESEVESETINRDKNLAAIGD
ncbi:MFS transporter [Oscillatoria sp. CS-180]|uniref:MFS transporter n=1 Tax=Oscillatoria sp. CS-180 TaxID=3021720 RepID=UPI002330099A|nr:MFS transporter [Oscillatoria sp. CS-180]MDB9524733.1 MFS transporter [Oscillatoria sp. CS-180]